MPPVTKTSWLGWSVDPVQLLPFAGAVHFSMPEGAVQRGRMSCAKHEKLLEKAKEKQRGRGEDKYNKK